MAKKTVKKKEEKVTKEEDRKEFIKRTFKELVVKHHPKLRFVVFNYLPYSGGRGILREVIGYNLYDKKFFREILQELSREGFLYHIGGSAYKLV